MILYGRGQSRSFRCLWALLEADVQFEYVSVDPESLPENYSKLNSQIKVPTLVDDELVLNESAAIVNYAGQLTKKELIPQDVKGRAAFDEISYFVMTEFEQPLWSMGKHMFALPEEHRIEDVLKTAKWEFEKAQTALQTKLNGREFAVGASFTLADVLLAQTLNWAVRFKMPVDDNLVAYRDRLYERAACQKALGMI
jgi:glutathione S-transferase